MDGKPLTRPERSARTAKDMPNPCRAAFIRALVYCLAGVAGAGALLVVMESVGHRSPGNGALHWGAGDFRMVRGYGKRVLDGLLISQTAESANNSASIMLRDVEFDAEPLPIVQWNVTGLTSDASLLIYWRTRNQAGPFHAMRLESGQRDGSLAYLGNHPGWRGTVVELGLAITGELRNSILVRELSLLPAKPGNILRTTWHDLTTFVPWNQTSINFSRQRPYALVRMGALGGAVLALAWVFWIVISIAVSRHRVREMMALIALTVWVGVDLFWQAELFAKLRWTYMETVSTGQAVQPLPTRDGKLVAFSDRVKKNMPAGTQRIYLVAPDRYSRYRGAYFLLPHNVYAGLPDTRYVAAGDYVAVFDVPTISYEASSGILRWENGILKGVTPVFADEGRWLFRISG